MNLHTSAARRDLATEISRQRRKTSGQPIETSRQIEAQPKEDCTSLFAWFQHLQEDHGIVVTKTTALHAFLSTVVYAERSRCAELAKQLGFEDVARAISDRPAPVWRSRAARRNGGKTNAKAA